MHAPHSHSTRHFAAERAPTAAAQWARLEGKSETMAAELLESALLSPAKQRTPDAAVCPRCMASATVGAMIALLLDRLIAGN